MANIIKMANSQLRKIFVYGTLKKGQPNHKYLVDTANGYSKYLCNGVSAKKLPMVVATRYNIPFLINKPGIGNYVMGEIYEVDEKMFEKIDELEDYPNFYDREIQDMHIGVGDGDVPCWVYFLKNYPEEILNLPFLAEYKNCEEYPYVERSKRLSNILPKNDLDFNLKSRASANN